MQAMVDTIPTEFEVLDERFAGVKGDHRIERFDFGCRWAEGAVYVAAGRYLLVSDIPNDRILRWDETTGAIGVFRHPAGYANGNILDRRGTAGHLRARQSPGDTHRARRLDHCPRRPVRR